MDDFHIDFIGIGAPRAGTTWLYRCLEEHPSLCLSRPKELNYFGDRNPFTPYNWPLGWDWYQSRFRHWRAPQLRGEVTPHYLHTGAAARIAERFPDCKLLLLLRNPADALYSLYRFHSHLRRVAPTFEEFMELEPEAMRIYDYADHVRSYLRHFPIRQLHVMRQEDVASVPMTVLGGVFHFLGVNTIEVRRASRVVNTDENHLSRLLGKRLSFFCKELMQSTALDILYRPAIRVQETVENLLSLFVRSEEEETMSSETRMRLMERYRRSNEEVSSLLGIDTSNWQKVTTEGPK